MAGTLHVPVKGFLVSPYNYQRPCERFPRFASE